MINKNEILKFSTLARREKDNFLTSIIEDSKEEYNFKCGEKMKINIINLREYQFFLASNSCSFSMASYFLLKENLDLVIKLTLEKIFIQLLLEKNLPSELLDFQNLFFLSDRRKNCVLLPYLVLSSIFPL